MSSRIFQSIIIQMKDATDRCIGVVDDQGVVAACNELSMIGTKLDDFHGGFGDYPDQIFTSNFRTYKPVGGLSTRLDYAVFVDGHDATARCVCILASVAFQEAKINYEEKHNKTIFVKNIISDNILPGDIYVRAKELHFATDVPRAVLLIRQTERTDMAALEAISNMFPDRQKDFVLSVNETDLVLIKELTGPADSNKEVYEIAEEIEEAARRSQSLSVSSASARRRSISAFSRTSTRKRRSPSRSARCSIRRNPSSTTTTSASAVSSISFPRHSVKCS